MRVVLFYVQNREVFFLNGFMHVVEYSTIVVVDMEEKTWRTIHKPCGAKNVHPSSSGLPVCVVLIFKIGLGF